MVPVLVFLTIAALLLLDWYRIQRRRKAARSPAPARSAPVGAVPEREGTLFYHPGHTWVRLSADGTATMGVCDVVAHLAGKLEDVRLPAPGHGLDDGAAAWTLASANGRILSQAAPLPGVVLATNQEIHDHPDLLMKDPYGRGWLLKARVDRLHRSMEKLLSGEAARQWLEKSRASLASALQPALGHAALDGGQWYPAFGDELDGQQWRRLRDELIGVPGVLAHPGPQPVRLY